MCYKDEVQKENAEKLQRKFEVDNVPDFIRRYFINIKSKLGAINYWIAIKDFINWAMESSLIKKNQISKVELKDFFDIEPEDVTLYLEYKEQNGMSPTTLETRKNILRSFWHFLRRQKNSEIGNVDDFFKAVSYEGIPSGGNNLIKKMPSDERLKSIEEKINRKKDDFIRRRNICVFQVLKGTGIRESELAGLDISNLYLEEEIPYIMVLRKGKYRERELKPVYLTGSALNAIKEWMEFRNEIDNIIDKSALFLNKNGKRFTENNIKSMFKTYGNGITPHMMRHWFATVMANTGNLAFTQQQLGHTSANTTINNYANGVYGMKDILSGM